MNSCAFIEWLKGLATPAIAFAGFVIAFSQLRLAHIRLTHDLFDRRYAVYAAARKLIQQICQNTRVTIEELSSFHYASGDAVFVLDEGLAAYLEKLRIDAGRTAELYDKIGRGNASPAEIDERWKLICWFASKIDAVKERFKPFLQYKRPWYRRFFAFLGIGFAVLAFLLLSRQVSAENAFSPPTATEVFHLRSECAALGQKIRERYQLPFPTVQEEISHYNVRTNRCYVEIKSITSTIPTREILRMLFDGQTGERLAITYAGNGGKQSRVAHKNVGWNDASRYIDTMMVDDRKQ
jgi:hypothetical protein